MVIKMDDYNEDDILIYLQDMIKETDSGDEAKKFAEAYKTMKEANTQEWQETERLNTELKKSKWLFRGTVAAAAIGAAITGFLKLFGDLKYQENCQKYEDEGAYCNYMKHKRK